MKGKKEFNIPVIEKKFFTDLSYIITPTTLLLLPKTVGLKYFWV